MEQAITAGLQMYNVSGEDWYLQIADETINFYMQYFVDNQYGEVYENRTRYGGFAWNEAKGNSGKAGYHSIETGYYTYLYGNLFYTHQPVILHYNFEAIQSDREILLTPLAINDTKLTISQVLLDGQLYSNYNSFSRVLNLSTGIGGHFEITYTPVITNIASEPIIAATNFQLLQNYPNPFNPSTKIRYTIPNVTLSGVEGSRVQLKIYDILGNEVATLVDEYREAGRYEVTFDASSLASGMYLYKLQAGNFVETKKMIFLK
jgi:hypothetical protein